MDNKNIIDNNSILYRCSQKFIDKNLSELNLGYGQINFLIIIYENEGISMQDLANFGFFDKGTVSKGVKKLEEEGYIRVQSNVNDKRIKCLYTCDSVKDIMAQLYMVRRNWWENITANLSIEQKEQFNELLSLVADSALNNLKNEEDSVKFFGLQKLTLLDYPSKMACTLFTGGCNFKCPFCQNSSLVFLKEDTYEIPRDNVFEFLNKRQGILEGVCISGGEPLINPNIENTIRSIKELGYKVKLDTNGSYPERLLNLINQGLIDYIAMDIKNSKDKYGITCGVDNFDVSPIEASIKIIMNSKLPYEFRTTIVDEFHSREDMEKIGEMIKGAKLYCLQNFEDSELVIKKGLHAKKETELKEFKTLLSKYVDNVEIRGI